MEDFTITHIGDTALSLPMPFKYIPAKGKTFIFQADDGTEYGTKNEGTPITFDNDFWICAYQTTQEFWETVVITVEHKSLNAFPSKFIGKTRPVEKLSWDDIQLFKDALNRLFHEGKYRVDNIKPNGTFGLPSETQWEYAAEAGQSLVFSGSQNLNDVAWYGENSNNQTMPAGLKLPNANKLYDMSGNVWEFCTDDYIQYPVETPKNGQPTLKNSQIKVLRGSGYFANSMDCRLRRRRYNFYDNRGDGIGFRLVFSPSSASNKS
jgi:formylglycine-generating enzyme